ncbi:hypothetical protein KFK09_023167 [Dendrobium nobile]|uniref:HAT C-terminal dimerisation domain-containing protein n=1 Tax=Dendrobium nobile TaxID=94219 RepID=A0A8T3AKS0_DENNO|nr:hypothetical protein KFK09_023167 [Dendrobium nobile]
MRLHKGVLQRLSLNFCRFIIDLYMYIYHFIYFPFFISNTLPKIQDFASFQKDAFTPRKSELDIYEPKIDSNIDLDILKFWQGNQYRFPSLSAMARDILCIPITTVASESAFSNSGRILDQYRSALKHDIVKALICAKDWLYGEHGDDSFILHFFFLFKISLC